MKILFAILFTYISGFHCYGQNPGVKVILHSIEGYGEHEEFARKAAAALETVINSEEFRHVVLETAFTKPRNVDNTELYDKIMRAHEETGHAGEDGVIDLRVRTLRVDLDEHRWRNKCLGNTIGVDDPGADGVTAVCPNWLQKRAAKNEISELAGHYAHEYMHMLGFDHSGLLRTPAWRSRTLVYVVGDTVAELARRMSAKQ